MYKPPTLTPKQVIARYKKLGFVEDHRTGSHVIMFNSTTKKDRIEILKLSQLLFYPFGPKDLGIDLRKYKR